MMGRFKLFSAVTLLTLLFSLGASGTLADGPTPLGAQPIQDTWQGGGDLCSVGMADAEGADGHPQGEARPKAVPPGPQEDDDWPIVRTWTEARTDESGRESSVTYTLRRNPSSPWGSEMPGVRASCSYAANESLQAAHTLGGITQYTKSSYYRYVWTGGGATLKAYLIYETREWWTRTATWYNLGAISTYWTYNGWNCSNAYSTDGAYGSFTPSWYTSTRTYDYIYDFTQNWVIKTPGTAIGAGLIKTVETTPAYEYGWPLGTLATEIRLWGE